MRLLRPLPVLTFMLLMIAFCLCTPAIDAKPFTGPSPGFVTLNHLPTERDLTARPGTTFRYRDRLYWCTESCPGHTYHVRDLTRNNFHTYGDYGDLAVDHVHATGLVPDPVTDS